MSKDRSTVKCEGRFHELREHLYQQIAPLVLEDRQVITSVDLAQMFNLLEVDMYSFDPKDPYYNSKTDTLRKNPPQGSAPHGGYLSLVPLIESPAYQLAQDDLALVREYALAMGNNERVAKGLTKLASHPRQFFRDVLEREPRTVVFPNGSNLGGYVISADMGIGTIIPGGMKGGGIRSDTPFLFGVYEQPVRGELNLAAVIGFWAQDNTMLVSQMQSCRNGRFPSQVPFGVGALHVAEIAAREMGFDKIATYSARNHPIFKEHPSDWSQFGADFVCIYDNSSKKLGFNGSRQGIHEKILNRH